MLYNPSWSKEFTRENLIAWLETKPPDESYCFVVANECLLAQWARSVDSSAEVNENISAYAYKVHGKNVILGGFMQYIASNEPWTFGAALKRAKNEE